MHRLGPTHDHRQLPNPDGHGVGTLEERRHRRPLYEGDSGRYRPAVSLAVSPTLVKEGALEVASDGRTLLTKPPPVSIRSRY